MSWPLPLRVVGVGSPLGDDAVGWQVVGQLQADIAGTLDAEFHRVEGGHRILDLLDGRGTLVLVDAVSSGATPGTVWRLQWPDPRLEQLGPGTTHHLRPSESLALAAALGLLPARVLIWAIEGEQFAPEADLSARVRAAVAIAVRQIRDELISDRQREENPLK